MYILVETPFPLGLFLPQPTLKELKKIIQQHPNRRCYRLARKKIKPEVPMGISEMERLKEGNNVPTLIGNST